MRFLSIFPLAGLLMIALLIALKVALLRRKGISYNAGQTKPAEINRFLYPLFLLLLLIWLGALAGHTFNINPFFHTSFLIKKLFSSPLLQTAGAFFILLSVLLMTVTLVHFKTSLRFGLNKNNQGKLITDGVFAYSRNPFFLSLDFYFVGQAMVFPGILFIAMALLALVGIHLFILKEEKFLQQYYQDSYTSYMQKVRRYF